MIGPRVVLYKRGRDEAEKPFWISYADLMTALMMLFLVIMTVSLLSLLKGIEGADKERHNAITKILAIISDEALKKDMQNVVIDKNKFTINFGDKARFAFNDYSLSEETEGNLRAFVPILLNAASTEDGRKWFKRVVVEGYTDNQGTYLYNLDLSLKRAESVVCALFAKPNQGEGYFTEDQYSRIRRLFMVGGFSFNSAQKTPEESRRVEFRLDFWTVDEMKKGKNTEESQNANPGFVENGACRMN